MQRTVQNVVIAAVVAFAAIPSRAVTLVTNMANAAGANFSPQSTFWMAQKFTTDANTWTVASMQFRGAKNNAAQPITISIYSHDGVNDLPLAPSGTFDTSTVTATAGVQTAAAVGTITLTPATSYWIVIAPGDVNTALWTKTADLTSTGTGTIDNRSAFSTNSGTSWSALAATDNLMIQVDSTIVPPPDTTPDAFAFVDQTNVAVSTLMTSNTITVSGINTGTPISVTGGSYSINGGAFTTAAGTVNNGDSVRVQQTSSPSFATSTDAVLTIGGVSDTFTVTTAAATAAVPALSVSAMLLLGVVLALAALLALRR
jgi:hypothetical protein